MYYNQYQLNNKVSRTLCVTIILIISLVKWKLCNAGLRIIGGRNALKDEFPFAVTLEEKTSSKYRQFCSGAVLTPYWVLTAAHCIKDKKSFAEMNKTDQNRVARYNNHFPKERGHVSNIIKELKHPGFQTVLSRKYKSGLRCDVGLMQTENIVVSRYGKVSSIDYTSIIGHEAFVLGNGITNATYEQKPLQVLKGILISCQKLAVIAAPAGMLCLMPRCGLVATLCGGDSGGPTVHTSGIVGVTSMGFGLCTEDGHGLREGETSGIISMVSPVIDWVANIIADKNAETS